MGAWGIKALERDEGLDVLDILKNEYVPEHPVIDLGEMIELMKEEVMLGSDFSQIDFLFDNTAMALAELYFQWKDNGKLDYDHEEAIWDKVTGFTASKEALAFLLRQLTDIKNEVPDEDGIREIMDLWKNEDSGEIAPAWLEHLNQLIDRLDSEQEARQMYIKKYWGNFIGGSDDSLNLVAFLEDQKKEEIPLSEIFSKIGLDKQNWDFRQTVEYLEFTHSDGVEMDFHFAIDVVTDLAAILLECSISGSVNLQDLDEYNTPARRIRITATPEEHEAMNKVLADFVQDPLSYDISDMMGEDEITDMASQVEMLRKELYEASGRNRNYHVKAEDVKDLLPDWEGADGCIATNRITVEGCKIGYCYREKPDGDWDSGWRFTAGDESEEYMDDPNNAGIYKLNTICNDDPDIIPLLNTPAPCAFERDENGVFQQIKDWKPDEDEEDPDMDILKQCQKWHEEDKHQKIVDALEAISAEERTPEMDMELARAYNNLADPSEPEGKKLLHRALELMQSHEEELGDTYSWNFRMGYAYYYLDQEGRALRYFEKALELHPGDNPKLNTQQDIEDLIDWCKKGISLPQFSECFRERTEDWWETFAEMEAELRQMMDEDKDHTRGAELVAQMEDTLNLVFDEISFEIGVGGEKYELILTPEGDKVKLFELVYFQKHAPKEVLEHWNILVGRQPLQNIGLHTEDGWDISGDDVQIWLEEQGENSFAISAYCEKLLPMLREEEGRAWWMLTTLTDQVLGEIPHMRYIDSFDVLEEPKAEPSFLLSQLPDKLREQGLELSTDPEAYLESYLGYKMEPKQDPDADWRLDTMVGSTCCVPLINGYLNADNDFMDDLHADGAVAGFFCYPLDTLREEEGTEKIFDFRDKLEELFTTGNGPEVLTLTGGATGLYCGYVDFIAWDIRTALNMAKEFFEGTDIPWAIFHTFRREAGSVPLKQQDDGTETENQDDELDETLTGMDYIPYTQQNAEAFFAQLEQWNDEDEYTRCIQALNAIPEDWRNYRIAYAMARALENYAIIGDHDEGTLKSKGDKALLRAIEVLESVREEGQDKAEWNMRMAYGYQYLYGQEEKAIPYAQRWAELDPEDENAPAVIRECKAEIRKRQRSRKKKAKFVPGDTPFEGFDLTNFWDDNWYALKEYVSDPPSDELIASVEEELGYKLPAAYIWLMKQHNGGIPVNTCYPCDEPTCWSDDHVAITGIFGIGREKSCSLCGELGSQFMIAEWEYPAIGVAICDCPSAGHDMIFLDYRACGPQGEPAVVHVDQENDYKITHLADSFEEFIRGLEHESLYDPDEDAEDLEDDADEEETDHKGSFAGSVLLSKAEWDKEQLIRDLREEWGIVDEEPDEGDEDVENSDDAVVMRVGNMMLIVTLFHGHIPDNEAEINAENNYMWPEAVEVAKAHKAHIMVAVLGEEEKLLERGKLFTKAMAVCCKQKYATGVYTSGVVFEPRFYEGLADMLKKDELPIFNWVWFGLYRSEGGLNGYTYGMDVFGKEEMEVLNTDAEPEELRDFLASLASYVLACDVTLQDGETIGFSADDKHTITRSPGVSLPEEQMTLKIGYEPIKGDPKDDDDSIGMDDVSYHIESIEEKELPIDPINAYNHMAIYLRWCMEHDLMGGKFLAEHGEVVNQVKADPGNTDLRAFIREELFGCLFSALFNQKGRAFAHYYYGENDAPYYPADIDDYALKYFGPSRYHSNEFQQEAYLFIPFDEKYYQAMAQVIEERFANWQGQDFDEDTLEPSEVAQAIMEYLDCECTYFPSMADDDPIMSAYSYARRLGVREDFIPVLIKPDETLLECLVMNADPENDADCYEFDSKAVEEYRKKMLSTPVKDGKAVLEELTGQRKEEAEEDDMDWEEEIIGEIDGGINNDRFASYWDSDTNMTVPLILAKIPVKNPWEIFAYLPFGNWNECLDTLELMAVAKYWFEQYDAVPAAMSHDELEFLLPAPVPKEKAIDVAVEQYGFCPDLDQNASIGTLADTIHQSTVWYFWWD
ncbi:immunity protein Imm33 domain-containing protein [[Clostridium] symbiosum]|uniref:immunity protein Imm33 domain-containing protein n=1 Tax=Clostridium symbiosum TaxID=1512 RepID=UPI0034A56E3C